MQTLVYFLISGAFFFFMMRFVCGAHVMGHGNRHRHDDGKPDASQSAEGVSSAPPVREAEVPTDI